MASYLIPATLLVLVLLGGLYLGRRRPRQPGGRLHFNPAALPAATYQIGQFLIAWDPAGGGRLTLCHQARPDRVLWATLPGRSFLAAGQGRETVTEARGLFFFRDRVRELATEQTLAPFTVGGDSLTLAGVLTGRGKAGQTKVRYRFTLTAVAPAQLRFEVTVDNLRYNRLYLTCASEPAERIFGFGEQFTCFNLKGRRVPLFVSEQGIGRGAQPVTFLVNLVARAGGAWHTTYAGVPHYITSRLRSLFLETYEYAAFDLRRPDRIQVELWAARAAGRILYGETPADLIREYTACAGRMRPLPDWVHEGAILGLQGGTACVRERLAQIQAHGAPVAALWLQDWVGPRTTPLGQQLWWNWELDRERYPEWDSWVAELAAQGIRVLTYLNPFVTDVADKPAHRRNLFREAEAQGLLVRDAVGRPCLLQNSTFCAGLLDLTNPAAWAWIKQLIHDELLATGVSGWMADYGEALPYEARLFSGEPAARFHNRYPEAWAQLNREAIEETGRGAELVFFTRAAYRQSPGLTTLQWLGDQLVTWDRHDGIKSAVTGLLSGGLSGFSLNHSDCGGFTALRAGPLQYRRGRELLWRWLELGALSVVLRTHEGSRPADNAQVYSDEESLQQLARCARLYRAWAFYRKQLVQEAAETGLPVARHLFIHYPDDPRVYNLSYQEFLLGSELLVAPVLDPGRRRVTVYLPAGEWDHLWTGQRYGTSERGTQVTVAAPLGQPGIFYRAGSAVGAELVANLQAEGLLPAPA